MLAWIGKELRVRVVPVMQHEDAISRKDILRPGRTIPLCLSRGRHRIIFSSEDQNKRSLRVTQASRKLHIGDALQE